MISATNKRPDGTIELTLTIPLKEVRGVHEEVVTEMTKNAQVPGFRPGKAPKKMVEGQLDKERIREETLKKLLPKAYTRAIEEHNLRPIINPKIHVVNIKEGKDWQFTAITCEAPNVELDSYKENVRKVTAKSKIVIPGREQEKPALDDVVKALLTSINVQLPQILVEQEVDRLLSQLLSEIKSLGLTLDRYLASTGKTVETLRQEYAKKAIEDLTLELALKKIAETESITVEEKDIDEVIKKAKDEKEQESLSQNRYVLASIIRQQKTLDFLRKL